MIYDSDDEEEHFDCTPPSSQSSQHQTGRELLKRSSNDQSWGIKLGKSMLNNDNVIISQVVDDSIAFISELEVGFIIKSVNGKQSYNEISNEISSKDRLALDLVYAKPMSQTLRRLSPRRISQNISLPTQTLSHSNNNRNTSTTLSTSPEPRATIAKSTIVYSNPTSISNQITTTGTSASTRNQPEINLLTNLTTATTTTTTTTTRNQPEIINLIDSDDEHIPTRTGTLEATTIRNSYDSDDNGDEMSDDWEADYYNMFPIPNIQATSTVQNRFPRPPTSEIINLLSSDDEDIVAKPTNLTISIAGRKKRKATEEASNNKDIKKIKVKKENERPQVAFGEANIGDDVVEVKASDVTTANDTSNGDIMDLDDTGDEIAFVGGNMQVMSELPHPRYVCTIHVFEADSTTKNAKHCPNCFCYICDIEAKDCDEWRIHCNATHKNEYWKKQKEIRKLKIFKHLKSSELTKLLKDNWRVVAPNFYAASAMMGLQISPGLIAAYFNEISSLIAEKAHLFFERTSMALQWSINDPSIRMELVSITASIIKFLQVAKTWPGIYSTSAAGSEQVKSTINKILIRIFLRCRDNNDLITSILDDIRPLENLEIDKIIKYFMSYLRKKSDDTNNDTSIINFLVETLAIESGTNHLTAISDAWPTFIFYVVCVIAKNNPDLQSKESAIIIENLVKKISEPQFNIVQNLNMLTRRKALSNIFLIEAFVRNISFVQESNKTLYISLTNLMLDKILVCCDFMNKLQNVANPLFIGYVNLKEIEVWINKLDESNSDSVHELLVTAESFSSVEYDSIAIAVCIRAIRLELQHSVSGRNRPLYPTSKLNLIAAAVLAHVAVNFSFNVSESHMDIDSSSSILTVTTTESSSTTLGATSLQCLSIASNAVIRYMSSVENLDSGVREIIKKVPVELLKEWCRVPVNCDPHDVENPMRENLGISLNDYCAKSLSKLYVSSPDLFSSQSVSQSYKKALMIVWKSQLNEYLEKGKDMKTVSLSYYLDAVEFISTFVKEKADFVQVFQEYNFVFEMSYNLVLCRKMLSFNKDMLRLLLKAKNLVDTFAKDPSNSIDISKRNRVVKLWSTLYGRIAPLALSTYVILSDFTSLASYSIEKPFLFTIELRKFLTGAKDLYKLTDDEVIKIAEIFSASVSNIIAKKLLDSEAKEHLSEFNNEGTFLNRAIKLAPATFASIALDALNNDHLALLIEQLKSNNQTQFIDQIKERFITEKNKTYVKGTSLRSYSDMYLLAMSLDLYKEAIHFVEDSISTLSNSKVMIGALTHVLSTNNQIEEALKAVTPLMAYYRLKLYSAVEIDNFIENNRLRWNELLATSLRFIELNFYYYCNVESIDLFIKYRSNSNSDNIAISTQVEVELRISQFLENTFKAKKITPVDYLKIGLLFFSKSKIEKLMVTWISNRDIFRKDVFSDFIITCLEYCSKSINLRELLYGFVAKLILKKTDDQSDPVISDKAKSTLTAEITMGGLSCSPDSLDFGTFTKYLDKQKDLKSAVLDLHQSYYFLRLVVSPTVEVFEIVKKFNWYKIEQKQIFRCILDCGSKGACILLNDKDGVMLTLEKLQQQISMVQKSNNLATECVFDGMTEIKKVLTREILQPSPIDGFAGLCLDLEAPFIRICKYLIAVNIFIIYLERELPTDDERILKLKTAVDELTGRIFVILDSNSLVEVILKMTTKVDVDTIISYSNECSKFTGEAVKNKAKDLIDVFIIHAADRIMSPNQRIDLFRKLLHLCQHPVLSKDIKCLLPERKLLTLSGSLNGEVMLSSMDSPKTLKFMIDCFNNSIVDTFIQLIREEGALAAQCIEEIVNTRHINVLKRLFLNKKELFRLFTQHILRLDCLKILFITINPDGPLDQSFNGDKYLASLATCPIQWKPFFDSISKDLLTDLLDAICKSENSALATKQMIQIFRVFGGFKPNATDRSFYNSLLGLEEMIKAKMNTPQKFNCNIVIQNTLKQFTTISEFDPSNLLHFKLFPDIIFFKDIDVHALLFKTNGVMHVTIFQNIWKNLTNVDVVLFENLKVLWFRILDHMKRNTVSKALKSSFVEFVTFFNNILNCYRDRGRTFWNTISNESSRRLSNKPQVKGIIQSISVRF